jgi:hypothetical protein
MPSIGGPHCLFIEDYLSQTTSSKSLKDNFSRRIVSLVGHANHHRGKKAQLHFQTKNCQKIE